YGLVFCLAATCFRLGDSAPQYGPPMGVPMGPPMGGGGMP
ncbi:hypothetical protein NPIL_552271, partial [Nephila pilipes]